MSKSSWLQLVMQHTSTSFSCCSCVRSIDIWMPLSALIAMGTGAAGVLPQEAEQVTQNDKYIQLSPIIWFSSSSEVVSAVALHK